VIEMLGVELLFMDLHSVAEAGPAKSPRAIIERLTSATRTNGRAADNEDPSFSADGRHVMFTSNRTGSNQIYIVKYRRYRREASRR
jgi:Tol biopolymer transport system component